MLRKFRKEDLQDCINIVDSIWKFNNAFKPKELADFFLFIYGAGSLLESNYAEIIEVDDDIVGFIFCCCKKGNSFKQHFDSIILVTKIVLRFIKLKNVTFKQRCSLFNTVRNDNINKRKAEPDRTNEIILFAVKPDNQGEGYGRKLVQSFIDHCRKNQINRIVLDTDEHCNYEFYNHLGFYKITEYYSPIAKLYAKDNGNSYVFELITKESI